MSQHTSENLQEKLQNLIESYQKQALAYYLHFETSERKLAQDIKNQIKKEYGSEKFMPAINWQETFAELADSDTLDDLLNNYFKQINYTQEHFVLPKDRLKNMLWENARTAGKKILENLSE